MKMKKPQINKVKLTHSKIMIKLIYKSIFAVIPLELISGLHILHVSFLSLKSYLFIHIEIMHLVRTQTFPKN